MSGYLQRLVDRSVPHLGSLSEAVPAAPTGSPVAAEDQRLHDPALVAVLPPLGGTPEDGETESTGLEVQESLRRPMQRGLRRDQGRSAPPARLDRATEPPRGKDVEPTSVAAVTEPLAASPEPLSTIAEQDTETPPRPSRSDTAPEPRTEKPREVSELPPRGPARVEPPAPPPAAAAPVTSESDQRSRPTERARDSVDSHPSPPGERPTDPVPQVTPAVPARETDERALEPEGQTPESPVSIAAIDLVPPPAPPAPSEPWRPDERSDERPREAPRQPAIERIVETAHRERPAPRARLTAESVSLIGSLARRRRTATLFGLRRR